MLKKDLLELCLLWMLSEEDRYGYELISRLRGGFPDTQESAVYALLRGLCRDGFTESYTGTVSGGPSRKYYHLTVAGQRKLEGLLEQWHALRMALEGMGIQA